MTAIRRREWLRGLGGTALLAAVPSLVGCGEGGSGQGAREPSAAPLTPGSAEVGFTLQTSRFAGTLETLLVRLDELGAEWVRLPLNVGDVSGGRTLVRRLTELGHRVLGIAAGYEGIRGGAGEVLDAGQWISYLDALLDLFPEVEAWQILNEPDHFQGIDEPTYVQGFLRPAYEHLKQVRPEVLVVSAAPVGSEEGPRRFRRMARAGLEHFCDVAAVHSYRARPSEFAGVVSVPIWMTETGITDRPEQVDFFRSRVGEAVGGPLGAQRVFWFELLDSPESGYGLVGPDGHPLNPALFHEVASLNEGRG